MKTKYRIMHWKPVIEIQQIFFWKISHLWQLKAFKITSFFNFNFEFIFLTNSFQFKSKADFICKAPLGAHGFS